MGTAVQAYFSGLDLTQPDKQTLSSNAQTRITPHCINVYLKQCLMLLTPI